MHASPAIHPATQRAATWHNAPPDLSVVIPVHNECDNIAPLLEEVVDSLQGLTRFELICVDDASSDASLAVLTSLATRFPQLRVLAHLQQAGQSTAVRNGVKAARGAWIATLDGDGQNDPADLPRMLEARDAAAANVKLVGGWRVDRRDTRSKRLASVVANALRRRLLRDGTPDTGCGIKLFEREAFLELPYFDHMHRYLPALMQRSGWKTLSVPVGHRERRSGLSKYNNLGRAWVGLSDLCGVAWLMRRSRAVEVRSMQAPISAGADARAIRP
ncbi:glycosyltransferase family 2 protein [Novilysobacter defluvii]|uniref:Dolichol-phosphate mannosyltransferase n=1 Tax=Lysobacter defluvii IMMIB APB-9 = DSM 18482 TaxID=1385515 RepID=A0A0A0MBI6_9GAMM|nr:glycosyltransferase family 2 protein [Lysobacter defluvii]KGO99732.1 dolichol-phosphate mannosyltransferase [Lysobacter defluvii IMMIB APB-9 = DSM 18482]